MKKPIKYTTANAGELIPITTRADRITRIACCDCNLVHFYRVVIRFDKNKYTRVYLQGWRDEKETKRLRSKKSSQRKKR